ncbi:Oidioi.mRNA.OKI2018_I69.XSR.g15003.t1.cds [Oikopleura dioica]|uniref:Oidioi.mRNA.OKI2018_I69.XSR.g15003.t1.cds n=1 Tax=Oikopleura dioica TaxID=34765 RepID=A0ABN7SFJ3_OIKDI|nr:Oidioi.mRNA.OKI2018_I69.XSR.g15003.t1.cds [Oikopleura dioica]
MQIDGFKERTWADWNAAVSKSVRGFYYSCSLKLTTQDYARSKFLDAVSNETPRNIEDRRLLTTLNASSFTLVKCTVCRKVLLPACLRAHCKEYHPQVKLGPSNSYHHEVPSTSKNRNSSSSIKEDLQSHIDLKLKKNPKRPISQSQIRSKRPRTESHKDDRVIILPRSQPIIIYGEISSDEEAGAVQSDSLPIEGISYMSRQVNPIAYPRYGCYGDVVKNSAIPPFSSAARQLNQHLALIAQPNPVVTAFEAQDFKGSSPMTPLS